MMPAMQTSRPQLRKYRVVLSVGGRKLTRHVRALDALDAEKQAALIAGALTPETPSLADVVALSVVEMGVVR